MEMNDISLLEFPHPGDVRTVHAGLAVGAILSELAFFRTDDSGGDAD